MRAKGIGYQRLRNFIFRRCFMRALPRCLALPLLFALAIPVLFAPAEFTRQDSLTTALQKIPAGKSIRLALLEPARRFSVWAWPWWR
jgi:hypothetical protein